MIDMFRLVLNPFVSLAFFVILTDPESISRIIFLQFRDFFRQSFNLARLLWSYLTFHVLKKCPRVRPGEGEGAAPGGADG